MRQPFRFTNGQSAINVEQLIEICEKFPTDGIYHLNREDFERWLNYIGETELGEKAKQARLASVSDEEALQQFLTSYKFSQIKNGDPNSSEIEETQKNYDVSDSLGDRISHSTSEDDREVSTSGILDVADTEEKTATLEPVVDPQSVSEAEASARQDTKIEEANVLKELENTQPSVPLSTATRLELPDEEEAQLQTSSPTVLQLSQAALVHKKTDTRFELPTTKNTVYIGRPNEELPVQVDLSDLEDADIISRVHAAIHVEDDKFFLEDAGSANGTWLNGEKLKPGIRFRKLLKSGDEIAFGKKQSIKLTFEQQQL